MKKLSIFLLFALLAPTFAQANDPEPKALKTAVVPADDTLSYVDLENNFMFQEKVYIHISDAADKPLVNNFYSREDLQHDKVLRNLLRKSTHYLTIDNYYYFILEE